MMLNKKSSSASLLKLLVLVPIVGVALALNAETVTDYVYAEKPQTQQKKVVKKGKKAAQVKVNAKTIEVKTDKDVITGENVTVELNADKQKSMGKKLVFLDEVLEGSEPLIVIDGKVATMEQLKALDQEEINNITVLKNAKEPLEDYAKHFNADTSNGILFINTKEYVKNGKKELVSAVVKAKEPAEESEEGAFDVVEQMPEYPGGMAEMMKFLSTNIKYPASALKDSIEGRVVASFIVEKDGSISTPKVVRHVSDDLDAEAIRVIELMPKWKPGRQKGQDVRVKYTLPVSFRLK